MTVFDRMKYIEMDRELIQECLSEEIDIDKLAKAWDMSHADALVKAAQVKTDLLDFLVLMCRMKANGKASMEHLSRLGPIFERIGADADAAAWAIKEFSEPLE